MSEASGNAPDQDASGVDDQGNEEKGQDLVRRETYLKTLKQEKAAKERAAQLEKELNEIRAKEEAEKAAKMKEKQQFEEYSKELEEKLERERAEKDEFKKSLLDTHKLQAVLDKLPGKPKRNEYLSFIDLDKVVMDEEGISQESVEAVANEFITNYGELLNRPGKDLPNDAPGSKGKLTYEQWKSLPLKEKRQRLKEVAN